MTTKCSVKKLSLTLALAAVSGMIGPRLAAADPATDAAATAPPTPGAAAAAPARPQTPAEKGLQAHIDPLQTQMAAAVSARRYDDYASALNGLAAMDCHFYDVSGHSTSRLQFLDAERQALAAQNPGLTETMHTLTLVITGQTALETAVVTDDEDATDTAGQYGAKGKKHHWERQTSLRLHWTNASTTPAPRRSKRNADTNDWKATEIAVTDLQTLLDGQPYIPPQPKTNTPRTTQPKTNTSRNRTRQPKIRRPRYPYVIPGVRVY